MNKITNAILFLVFCMLQYSSIAQDTLNFENDKYDKFRIHAGMAHWVSDSYRTALMGTDLGFGIGYRPGTPWLEIYSTFEFSKLRIDSTHIDYEKRHDKHIGFNTLGLSLQKQFFHKNQSAILAYNIGGVLISIQDESPTMGISAGFTFEYLFKVNWLDGRMGIIVDYKTNIYNISDGDNNFLDYVTVIKKSADRDANLVMGVVYRF